MDESFVPLATLLRAPLGALPAPPAPPVAADAARAATAHAAPAAPAHADVVHELALVRVAAIEAFERSAAELLRALAADVLVRELALAPADLSALVAAALERFAAASPIALVVSQADAPRVRATLPVRVDATLGVGDLVVEVRDGTLESPLQFRLDAALAQAEAA